MRGEGEGDPETKWRGEGLRAEIRVEGEEKEGGQNFFRSPYFKYLQN